MGLMYVAGSSLAKICFTAFARWEVHGKEAMPPMGPLIVVCNHLSNADPPILSASLPRQLYFLGKRSLFSNPISSAFLTAVGVHPLNRDGQDLEALRWNIELLKKDKPIVLFPEGARSQGEGMRKGHPGVAYIAVKTQAPILPVGITGTENIRGYLRMPFPLCRMTVTIGDPFSLPLLEGRITKPILQQMTDMIMYRVASLLPPGYRGHYGSAESASQP